jgi:hypothetical protein
MCEPCQQSSGSQTHIHYRYSPDMVHTYTTKHTYTQPLISWHGSHIYHQTHIHYRYSPDMVHTYTTKHTYTEPLIGDEHHLLLLIRLYVVCCMLYCEGWHIDHMWRTLNALWGEIGKCVNHVRRVVVVYMCEPCQESSGCVYVCLVIYVWTMSGVTWFTHIPPNTHIHNRYSLDMVHTYTTKHTYSLPLLSWHDSHIYHQTHIYTIATFLTWFTHISPNTHPLLSSHGSPMSGA